MISRYSGPQVWGLFFSIVVLVLAFVFAAKAAGDDKIVEALAVHQLSIPFGEFDLYLSRESQRLVARSGDLIIASNAPGWDILVFSRKNNSGFIVPAKDRDNKSLGLLDGVISIGKGVPCLSREKVLGYDCTCLVSLPDKANRNNRDTPLFQERHQRALIDTTYKLATLCEITPPMRGFLSWVYKLGARTGVPLESKTRFQDGTQIYTYRTTSIKHVSKARAFFAYPTGFKREKSLVYVLLEQNYSGTLEDLLGGSSSR